MPRTKTTKNSMELNINFARDLNVPTIKDQDVRERVGQAIIDQMVKRTSVQRKSLSGGNFIAYSEKYAKQKGVPRGRVDLLLSSDMLDSIDIIKQTQKSLTIGFNQSDQIPKAFNHHTGDTLPRRPFFGIQQKELSKIQTKFKKQITTQPTKRQQRREDSDIETEALGEAFVGEFLARGLLFGPR